MSTKTKIKYSSRNESDKKTCPFITWVIRKDELFTHILLGQVKIN